MTPSTWGQRWFHVTWVAVGLEIFLIPPLIAFGVLEGDGQIAAISVVGVTLIAAILAPRQLEQVPVKPIVWVGLGGIVAQVVAAPFLETHLETVPFPGSLAPRLDRPIPIWAAVVGALGAMMVGFSVLRFGNRVRAHLFEVPLPYRSAVSRFGNAARTWGEVEFMFALVFITALSPTVWNRLRWILIPIIWVGCLTSGFLLLSFLWKEWRDKDFKRFWAEFDLPG